MSKKLIYLVSVIFVLGLAGNAMAQIDPATVTTGHVYLLNDANFVDGTVPDDSANDLAGIIVGEPNLVDGLYGKALSFDGVDDAVDIPDSQFINVTNGPWANKTVMAVFNCADVSKSEKQTVYEQGGLTRGLTIYVHEGLVYVGGWNKAEYQWNPGSWISAPIGSNEWHTVALVIRDGADAEEDDKFEMWVDGDLIGKAVGGQIYNHGNDNAIGYTNQNNVFHDGDGSGDGWYFEGLVDEVWILNDALTPPELAAMAGTTWPYAYDPDPVTGATIQEFSALLTWQPGDGVVSHDVYLGSNLDDVVAGTGDTFKGNQPVTSFLAVDLVPDTTYYWRIAEANDADPNAPYSKEVWSFSLPPRHAYNPDPADGVKILDTTANLTWTPGWTPIMHQTYFGTDPDQVANAAGAPLVMDIGYDTGELQPDTTYYWRVDEFYGIETVKGPVWSFSTVPVLPLSDDPNLVGQWTFDGDSGGVVLDQSGHGGHASLVGDVQLVAGVIGEALEFDGSGGDYAEAASYAGVTGTHSRTVSAWIKTTDYGEIASWGLNSAGQKWIFRVQESNGTLGAIRIEVNGGYQVGSIDVRDDEWHQVAAVLVDDGSPDATEISLYVDGFLENSSAQLDEPIDTADGVVRIGEAPWHNRPFVGQIDDVRIYDKAFTEDEMRQLQGNLMIAWQPQPGMGDAGDVWTMGTLSWTAGDGAAEHDVYLGTNADAVAAADATDASGIYRGRQADASYAIPEKRKFETAYYWRVDEVAADGTISAGRIWTFGTEAELVIYDVETPFDYDTSVDPFVSEISLDLDPALDLTYPIARLALSYTGNPAPGSVTVDDVNDTVTVVGRGADIWGTADEFQYAYTMITGNGSMTVKVDSLAHTDDWTKAGIMIRETLDAGSSFAAVYATGVNGVRFQARSMTDQDATSDTSVATDEQMALTPPVWIKIERAFPMVNAYYSTDGVTFVPMSWNPQVVPMSPAPIYIGLAVTSHSGAETYAEAVFSELSSDGGVTPGPLTSAEIGLTGNAAEPMYLVLDDASGAAAAVLNPDPAATQQTSATDFTVDLADFAIDLAAVTKASLVIGDLDAPAPGGSGSLTINNVRLLGPKGPVGYWTLDETSGTTAADSSGNGNDGTLEDGPTVVEGQFGLALAFEVSRVAIPASDSLTADLFQGSFTLAAWINPTRTGGTWQQIFRSMIAADTSNDTLFINNDGRLSWRGRVGGAWAGGMCETAPDVVPADQWTHFAVVGDETNFRIYVNGALSQESAFQTTDGSNATYYLGGDPTWTGESYSGMVDDVRIYDRALSEDEVLELASQ